MTVDELVSLQKNNFPNFNHLIERHGFDPKGFTKFYNHQFQWHQAASRVVMLGLSFSPPTLRCLDIGPAAGHFPFLLTLLGHQVHTLEVPNNPVYLDSLELLGIPTTKQFVLADTPLPDIEPMNHLDFISACGVCFDVSPEQTKSTWHYNHMGYIWSVEEWVFFIEDMLSRLNSGGRLYIRFNYNWPGPQNTSVWVVDQPAFRSYLHGKKYVLNSPDLQIWKD